MAKRRTEIFSIFGQIESVVAEAMIEEGKATKIEARDIPPSVAFNEADQPAHFAVIIVGEHVPAFKRRIADLRT